MLITGILSNPWPKKDKYMFFGIPFYENIWEHVFDTFLCY